MQEMRFVEVVSQVVSKLFIAMYTVEYSVTGSGKNGRNST